MAMTKSYARFLKLPKKGWLRRREAKLLRGVAEKTKGPILEVGCYYGKSTVLLASLDRPVYTVDPFESKVLKDYDGVAIKKEFLHNLKIRNITNVLLFHEPIEEWKPRTVGFAYLDGDHTYESLLRQIEIVQECGAKSVCIHDFGSKKHPDVARAVCNSNLYMVEKADRMAHCVFNGTK